jgi:hypothetical protein
LRYCLRAPLSLERLSIELHGNVIYQVKATRHGNETQRVMSPMQFMGRLVALIPPPYHPLLRYFGVFGPHAAWRKLARVTSTAASKCLAACSLDRCIA